ncbi:MAG: signal peptidase II [Pseudomonadota bacterium]
MIKWLGLAGAVVAVDQWTKWVVVSHFQRNEVVDVLPFFSWVYWTNEGAAFSILAGAGGWQRWFFVVLACVFSVYLIYEISRLRREERAMGWVFGLILGGAIGNLIDRWLNGYVVDFIYFNYEQYTFPAFNIADSALFCGAALWIYLMIQEHRAATASKAE